jgi:hypothetical protein
MANANQRTRPWSTADSYCYAQRFVASYRQLWGEKSLKSLFSVHTSALLLYLYTSSCSFSTGVCLVSEQPVSQPSDARSILGCSEFQLLNEQVIRLLVQGMEHDRGTCPVELKERYPYVERDSGGSVDDCC